MFSLKKHVANQIEKTEFVSLFVILIFNVTYELHIGAYKTQVPRARMKEEWLACLKQLLEERTCRWPY